MSKPVYPYTMAPLKSKFSKVHNIASKPSPNFKWLLYIPLLICASILVLLIWFGIIQDEPSDGVSLNPTASDQSSSPTPPDPNDPWYQRNSIDLDRGLKPDKTTQREAESAWRLRSERGIHVERMNEIQRQTKSGDFIDANGRTYNMVGNCDPRFVQPDKMRIDSVIDATSNHLTHDGLDFVVADLNGFGSQAQTFLDWYRVLDDAMKLRIIIVGVT